MSEKIRLPDIPLPEECNYIAAFLTMSCPYKCSYCINEFESSRKRFSLMSAQDWIQGLSRLVNLEREEGVVPVTLSGGEPSVHPGFYDIINGLPERIRIDILTNLSFDVEEMIARVDPARLHRSAPYASIRVSYHPDQVELDELLAKTHRMLEGGFSIGIWGVLHPDQQEIILRAQEKALAEGIDFRTKEFLGYAHGKLYGKFLYPQACNQQAQPEVLCRTTELIIAPDGNIHRCHHDLYERLPAIGHILDADYQMALVYRRCSNFGFCNPCDIKVKTNRLQKFGYTAVSILFPQQNVSEIEPPSRSRKSFVLHNAHGDSRQANHKSQV